MGDVKIAIERQVAGELRVHGGEGTPIAIEGDIEAGGEEAGFKSGGAEHGLLREGHSLEGEQLLGVERNRYAVAPVGCAPG